MQIKDLIPWARRSDMPGTKGGEEGPMAPVASLQREMNRVFETFWKGMENPTALADWPWSSAARSDVVETDGAIEVSIELPGMEMSDLDVSVSDDVLTIKGEKKVERQEDKKGYYLSERSYGSVYRTIPLPPGTETDKADATFKNGVLTVRLPKSAEAQSNLKRVEVKGG